MRGDHCLLRSNHLHLFSELKLGNSRKRKGTLSLYGVKKIRFSVSRSDLPDSQRPMQPTPGGSAGSSSSGATSELSRIGLARFRSAPPTWLEQLLEEEEDDDPLKPGHSFTQILTACSASRGSTLSEDPLLFEPAGFQRQNSSPADFVGNSGFPGLEIPANYDYFPSDIDVSPASKRAREGNSQYSSPKFQKHLKGEEMDQATANLSSSADLGMEKLLDESVPCRVRAKRGYATHPRSIAERVRRTRISDRIRKLQELVPNMDKQTNTADMLDEALEYVKNLQRQIQELTELERKCKCKVKDEG